MVTAAAVDYPRNNPFVSGINSDICFATVVSAEVANHAVLNTNIRDLIKLISGIDDAPVLYDNFHYEALLLFSIKSDMTAMRTAIPFVT